MFLNVRNWDNQKNICEDSKVYLRLQQGIIKKHSKMSSIIKTQETKTSRDSFVKPAELIDIIEMEPITSSLNDKRVYNLLVANAWDTITEDKEHQISKRVLRGAHTGSDRLDSTIENLMKTVVRTKILINGEPAIIRFQLLADNIEYDKRDGIFVYRFPPRLRQLIKSSSVFARLSKETMFLMASKYALSLYEIVQKRVNLKHKSYEDFSVEEFRGMLGVPTGRLKQYRDLNASAIKPALRDVNEHTNCQVAVEPLKKGKKVEKVRLHWILKQKSESLPSAPSEEMKIDNNRMFFPKDAGAIKCCLKIQTVEKAKQIISESCTGLDVYALEHEYAEYAVSKGEAIKDIDQAFLGFVRSKVKKFPKSLAYT